VPGGYSTLIPGAPLDVLPSNNDQALGDYAERGRTVVSNRSAFAAEQVWVGPVAKWTDILPVLTIDVPAPIPGAPNPGNPFIWYEISFQYQLSRADLGTSTGPIGASMVVKDSVELASPPSTMDGIRKFSINGTLNWWDSHLGSTLSWRATPGTHVIRPGIQVSAPSGPFAYTFRIRNFFAEGGSI
jgi:hypothetical protein